MATRSQKKKPEEIIVRPENSRSVYIREDEIFTGEEAVFTLKFPTMAKLRAYFPDGDLTKHLFFVSTDVKKPVKARIIVRIVHPETQRILVLYCNIMKYGPHPTRSTTKGLYFKIAHLDDEQTHLIRDFAR